MRFDAQPCRCHAALLEELLSEGYSYVLTSRFGLKSDPLEKFVAEDLLCNEGFVCEQHEDIANKRAIRIICNVFLNNQRKRRTETVVKDRVVALKQSKRSKGN